MWVTQDPTLLEWSPATDLWPLVFIFAFKSHYGNVISYESRLYSKYTFLSAKWQWPQPRQVLPGEVDTRLWRVERGEGSLWSVAASPNQTYCERFWSTSLKWRSSFPFRVNLGWGGMRDWMNSCNFQLPHLKSRNMLTRSSESKVDSTLECILKHKDILSLPREDHVSTWKCGRSGTHLGIEWLLLRTPHWIYNSCSVLLRLEAQRGRESTVCR
jgi:hypothetical protein